MQDPVTQDPVTQDPDTITAQAFAPPSVTSHDIPRLGIGHLILWMALTVVVIAVTHWQASLQASYLEAFLPWIPNTEARTGLLIYGMIRKIITGASWAVLAMTLYWWAQGRRFVVQPGHWLLLCMAATSLVGLPVNILFFSLSEGPDVSGIGSVIQFVAFAGGLLFGLIIPALGVRKSTPWLCFVLLPFGSLWLGEISYQIGFYRMGQHTLDIIQHGLTLSLLVVAIYLDRRDNPNRNWLHWTAVGVYFAKSISWFAWTAYYWRDGLFLI